MNTMGQQQQSQQATIAVSIGSGWSCTPHLPAPDYRWYVHYEDFQKICKDKASDASALRGLETMTNNRIRDLRRFEDLPVDTLPNEDDLWIEISGYGLAEWNIDIYSDRTYNHSLVSLIDCGFLHRRFVAYPGRYMLEPVAATIYLDRLGNPFIIVDNDAGDFIDDLGEPQNAKDAGYTVIRRQYLYQIEAINAALSKLAGQSPPVPMPRWHSLQRKALTSETTKSTASQGQSITSQQTSVAQGCLDDEIKGEKPGDSVLFANKNNTESPGLSLENPKKLMSTKKLSNSSVSLHRAPWSPETCVALSAQINHELFAIPAHIDEEVYNRNWRNAAQRLIEKRCADIAEPSRAWERIELHIWAMLIGQTWYAQGRTNKTPFSLRNVESNWDTVEAELRKGSWPNYEHIEYAGPPLFDDCAESSSAQATQSYAQGYTAQPSPTAQPEESSAHYVESTAQILEITAQGNAQSSVVEVVVGDMQNDDCALRNEQTARSVRTAQSEEEAAQSVESETAHCAMETGMAAQGMDITTTCIVDAQIRREYPDITIGVSPADDPGFFILAIEVAMDTWYDIVSLADYLAPTPQTQEALAIAEAYGKQRNAAEGNGYSDSQGPPGYDDAGEGGSDASW